ncbi:MAG TPA: hypothetical protein VG675_13510, partial [Bryobacteraceae bacterium]|nr:hypothetical protein [Bryobacteraceae bacterium]
HLWAALRYAELNPVRAGMTPTPELYRWSSAATHCGCATGELPLQVDIELWGATWDALSWREYLGRTEAESDAEALRSHSPGPGA